MPVAIDTSVLISAWKQTSFLETGGLKAERIVREEFKRIRFREYIPRGD